MGHIILGHNQLQDISQSSIEFIVLRRRWGPLIVRGISHASIRSPSFFGVSKKAIILLNFLPSEAKHRCGIAVNLKNLLYLLLVFQRLGSAENHSYSADEGFEIEGLGVNHRLGDMYSRFP